MFETTNELMNQIQLGEDTSPELKDLRFKGHKVNDPRRNSMADELAAMANTANGVLVLGADDKSKTINGIPENKLDVVESWIREICNDLISPPLLCLVRKHKLLTDYGSPKAIIRVDVPKSLHVHRSPGGYFQRIGSSKREMSPEVLARLFQQRSQKGLYILMNSLFLLQLSIVLIKCCMRNSKQIFRLMMTKSSCLI